MLNDDLPNTPMQARQVMVGKYLAMSDAVHALIATHPDVAAFSASFRLYQSVTSDLLLQLPVLQGDDGMRQAYGETIGSLWLAAERD